MQPDPNQLLTNQFMKKRLLLIGLLAITAVQIYCMNNGDYRNPFSVSFKSILPDPFIGTFKGYGADNAPIEIIIAQGNEADSYLMYINGLGPQTVIKAGKLLLLTENDVVFSFEAVTEGLMLRGNGQAITLTRVGQNNTQAQNTTKDPFTGTYEMFGDNVSFGKVTITCTGGLNYQLASTAGTDLAKKSGNQLSGVSDGYAFTVTPNGNDLSFNTQGVTIQFRRLGAIQAEQPSQSSVSKKIDQRLLGLWRYTSVQKSGGAQLVTDHKFIFYSDGTYTYKTEWAGLGSSGEDPMYNGKYEIVSMGNSGGKIKLDGNESEYFLTGKNLKIGSTIYEFIRK
jgi:hypothetical protein